MELQKILSRAIIHWKFHNPHILAKKPLNRLQSWHSRIVFNVIHYIKQHGNHTQQHLPQFQKSFVSTEAVLFNVLQSVSVSVVKCVRVLYLLLLVCSFSFFIIHLPFWINRNNIYTRCTHPVHTVKPRLCLYSIHYYGYDSEVSVITFFLTLKRDANETESCD